MVQESNNNNSTTAEALSSPVQSCRFSPPRKSSRRCSPLTLTRPSASFRSYFRAEALLSTYLEEAPGILHVLQECLPQSRPSRSLTGASSIPLSALLLTRPHSSTETPSLLYSKRHPNCDTRLSPEFPSEHILNS